MNSEAIAYRAYGAMSVYGYLSGRDHYIPKNEWNEDNLRRDLKYKNVVDNDESFQKDHEMEIAFIGDRVSLDMDHFNGYVSDFYLKIQIDDYENNIANQLNDWIIVLKIGGEYINKFTMLISLYICRSLGKKCRYDENFIYIPICSILPSIKKFPLHKLTHHTFVFEIEKPKSSSLKKTHFLCFHYSDANDDGKSEEFTLMQSQLIHDSFGSFYRPLNPFSHIGKVLILVIPDTNNNIMLEQCHIQLDGCEPIVYESQEIKKKHFHQYLICLIPLNPDQLDLKKMFKSFAYDFTGIYFSRINDARVKMIFSGLSENQINGTICLLNQNILRVMSGFAGLGYSDANS
jgi:hypothetical protein